MDQPSLSGHLAVGWCCPFSLMASAGPESVRCLSRVERRCASKSGSTGRGSIKLCNQPSQRPHLRCSHLGFCISIGGRFHQSSDRSGFVTARCIAAARPPLPSGAKVVAIRASQLHEIRIVQSEREMIQPGSAMGFKQSIMQISRNNRCRDRVEHRITSSVKDSEVSPPSYP